MTGSGGLSPHPPPLAAGPEPDPRRGVFETMLVAGGRPRELDAHLARLDASLRELFGAPAPEGARGLLLETAAPLRLARLRITVAPSADAGGSDGALEATVTAAEIAPAMVLPADASARLEPVTVRDWRGAHKWADRRLLEAAEARCAPAVPLLVDEAGLVLEGSRANVFAVIGGGLVTPPLDGRILPGVTRARVCALAREERIALAARPLPLAELLEADEVLLTGGVRGIEPVAACGAATWPAGPVTRRLAAALAACWRYSPNEGAGPDLR